MLRTYSLLLLLLMLLMSARPANLMAQSGSLNSPAALRDLLMAAERVTLAENEMYVYQKGGAPTVVLEIRQTVGELLQARPNNDFRHRFIDLGTIGGARAHLRFRAGGSREINILALPRPPERPDRESFSRF